MLEAFSRYFSGDGLNLTFQPNSRTPNATEFSNPVTPAPPMPPMPPNENMLQVDLRAETLNFVAPFGSVPHRGLEGQQDSYLNGVPYMQINKDVAKPVTGKGVGVLVGIHSERGAWLHLPVTNADPPLPTSRTRLVSIPHGTTINAQCLGPTQTVQQATTDSIRRHYALRHRQYPIQVSWNSHRRPPPTPT